MDIRVTLTYGSYHDVDSSEMAFKIAGSMASRRRCRRASPVLLEPIMAVEVVTPEDYMGDVIGDLSSRRGRVEGMDQQGNNQVIRAQVPLAEMFGYATDLRSRTQGRATYTMQFESTSEVPESVAKEIVARATGASSRQAARSGRPSPQTRHSVTDRVVPGRGSGYRSREQRDDGQAKIRAHQAPRQHRDHGSHRPRQDHA